MKPTSDCPGCGETLRHQVGVRLGLEDVRSFKARKATIGKTGGEDKEYSDEYQTTVCVCPCCGVSVQMDVKIEIVRVRLAEVGAAGGGLRVGKGLTNRTVTPEMMMEIGALRRSGAVDAYKQAWERSSPDGNLKYAELSLLRWIQNASPRTLDPWFYEDFGKEFEVPSKAIQFFGFGPVVGVIVRSSLRWFIPIRYVGKAPNFEARRVISSIPTKAQEYQYWKRTKFGYVVGDGEFFQEMRKKAPGDFAKAAGNY